MELDPADGRAFWLKGHIYKDLDRKNDAVPLLKDALTRTLPEKLRDSAREDLAEILVEQGDYAAALELTKTGEGGGEPAIGLMALHADAFRGLGRAPKRGPCLTTPWCVIPMRRRCFTGVPNFTSMPASSPPRPHSWNRLCSTTTIAAAGTCSRRPMSASTAPPTPPESADACRKSPRASRN